MSRVILYEAARKNNKLDDLVFTDVGGDRESATHVAFSTPVGNFLLPLQAWEGEGPKWEFQGSVDNPTVSPAVRRLDSSGDPDNLADHFFLIDGEVRYLPDCQHHLAGKKIQLEECRLLL